MMLGDIVKALRESNGWGTPEVARRASKHGPTPVSYQKIQQLEAKPDTSPGYLPQLAAAFQKSIDDLLSWRPGMPTMGPNSSPETVVIATDGPLIAPTDRSGYVRLALLDEAGGMGSGVLNGDYPEVIRELAIAEWEVRRRLGFVPSAGRIRLLTGRGPSMRPRIDNGDVVMVDTDVNRFDGDAIYVIVVGGETQIKMLQMRVDGLYVVSANQDYPPYRADDVHVRGKVLAVIGVREL